MEVAGIDAKVVVEAGWDYRPTTLYEPPQLDFSKIQNNRGEHSTIDIRDVAKTYCNILTSSITTQTQGE